MNTEPPKETPQLLKEKLAMLRIMIASSPELSKLGLYQPGERKEVYLHRFLRVHKFDCAKALKRLIAYETFVHEKGYKDIKMDKEIREFLQNGLIYCDPLNTSTQGHQVIYMDGEKYSEIFKVDLAIIEKSIWYIMEKCSYRTETQQHGFVMCADMSKFLLHLSDLSKAAELEKVFLRILQDVFPMKIGYMVILNEGMIFDALYAIVKLFMKEKLRKRLKLCGKDSSFIRSLVENKCLCDFVPGGKYVRSENRLKWVDRLDK